jgi:hypothetical protein
VQIPKRNNISVSFVIVALKTKRQVLCRAHTSFVGVAGK